MARTTRQKLGEEGETAAEAFLKKKRYSVIKKNYRNRFGEIDIIARHKGTFCFIEVKTRRNESYGLPEEAVPRWKQLRIIRAARVYAQENALEQENLRFDVMPVFFLEDEVQSIDLIPNAFDAV